MFSKFQCFFWMFFSHMSQCFLDSCANHFHLPDHQFVRSKSLENVLCMILWVEEHMWEITKSGEFWVSFVNSTVTSDIIAGIGAYTVWAHTRTLLWSIKTLLNKADIDRGLCTATGTSKCTLHLHSHTWSLSELDFWIQEVEVLTNLTSCISTKIGRAHVWTPVTR